MHVAAPFRADPSHTSYPKAKSDTSPSADTVDELTAKVANLSTAKPDNRNAAPSKETKSHQEKKEKGKYKRRQGASTSSSDDTKHANVVINFDDDESLDEYDLVAGAFPCIATANTGTNQSSKHTPYNDFIFDTGANVSIVNDLCPTNKAALIIPDAMTIHKFKNKMGRMNYLKNNNIDYKINPLTIDLMEIIIIVRHYLSYVMVIDLI
jgi:hypothetical protein